MLNTKKNWQRDAVDFLFYCPSEFLWTVFLRINLAIVVSNGTAFSRTADRVLEMTRISSASEAIIYEARFLNVTVTILNMSPRRTLQPANYCSHRNRSSITAVRFNSGQVERHFLER